MSVERIGVLSGDRLSVKVDPSVVDATPDDGEDFGRGFEVDVDHSFKTVGGGSGRDRLTVTLEAGTTRLRVYDTDVVFDGFRYFPTDYEGERRHAEGAKVDFAPDDGGDYWPSSIDGDHPVRNFTVRDLVVGFDRGRVVPLPKRDD